MDSTELDDIKFFMLNIVRQIAYLEVDKLEAHVEAIKAEQQRFDSIGPMLDPTYWMRARNTGEFDLAVTQLRIVEHLLEIRKLMDRNEGLRQEYLRKTGNTP